MGFEESPSLNLYKDGLPPKLPDPGRRKKVFWWFIVLLIICSIGLIFLKFQLDGTLAVLTGTGSITGFVYDELGNPVEAEVFVFRTNVEGRSNEEGYFDLSGVPIGEQIIVIAYRNIGREFVVTVRKGETFDMGQLRFLPADFQNGWSQ